MFAVDDIDGVVAHMCAHGAELIGELLYEDAYRLAYIRGPEGLIVGLAEQLRYALCRDFSSPTGRLPFAVLGPLVEILQPGSARCVLPAQ